MKTTLKTTLERMAELAGIELVREGWGENEPAAHEFTTRGKELFDQGWTVSANKSKGTVHGVRNQPKNIGSAYSVFDNTGTKVYDLDGREASWVQLTGEDNRASFMMDNSTEANYSMIGYAFMVINDMIEPFNDEEIQNRDRTRMNDINDADKQRSQERNDLQRKASNGPMIYRSPAHSDSDARFESVEETAQRIIQESMTEGRLNGQPPMIDDLKQMQDYGFMSGNTAMQYLGLSYDQWKKLAGSISTASFIYQGKQFNGFRIKDIQTLKQNPEMLKMRLQPMGSALNLP